MARQSQADRIDPQLSLLAPRGLDAVSAADPIYNGDEDHETDFAIDMVATLRTAARAADDLAGRYRELARRLAAQVDGDVPSDVDPSGPPIGQAF